MVWAVFVFGVDGLYSLLASTGCSGHGEAERGDAPVPLQGALQSADSGGNGHEEP